MYVCMYVCIIWKNGEWKLVKSPFFELVSAVVVFKAI